MEARLGAVPAPEVTAVSPPFTQERDLWRAPDGDAPDGVWNFLSSAMTPLRLRPLHTSHESYRDDGRPKVKQTLFKTIRVSFLRQAG